jgi:hypothetical protein
MYIKRFYRNGDGSCGWRINDAGDEVILKATRCEVLNADSVVVKNIPFDDAEIVVLADGYGKTIHHVKGPLQ